MKFREIIQMIQDDGWVQVGQRGSHRQFKHPTKSGLVTVAGKPGDDLAPGTLNSILKQTSLKEKSELWRLCGFSGLLRVSRSC